MTTMDEPVSPEFRPKNKSHPMHSPNGIATPTCTAKHKREERGLQLALKNVIGTTTSSANGFDSDPVNNSFVCCAGPAVVLCKIDEHLNISQRFFRAKPNVLPINATQSFYNASTPPRTPVKQRHGTPFKPINPEAGSVASPKLALDSPAHIEKIQLGREATCVSMSQGGQLLAVGEVRDSLDTCPKSTADMCRQDTILELSYFLQNLTHHMMFH